MSRIMVVVAVSRVHREREEHALRKRKIGEQRQGRRARKQSWGRGEKEGGEVASKCVPLGFRSDRVSELGK